MHVCKFLLIIFSMPWNTSASMSFSKLQLRYGTRKCMAIIEKSAGNVATARVNEQIAYRYSSR